MCEDVLVVRPPAVVYLNYMSIFKVIFPHVHCRGANESIIERFECNLLDSAVCLQIIYFSLAAMADGRHGEFNKITHKLRMTLFLIRIKAQYFILELFIQLAYDEIVLFLDKTAELQFYEQLLAA